MYRYGMSLVAVSESFVFDCIHDVFTEIWVKRDRLTVPDNVRYYLLKCLKVRGLHLLQRQQRPHQIVPQTDFDDLWADPSVEDLLAEREDNLERQTLVRKLIDQLPPRQQEAIRLRFVEALVRQSKQPDVALTYLNKIRQRARNSTGGAPGILPDYTPFSSDAAFLLAIENERRVELAFENHRWFDLVRTERAKPVMTQEQKVQNGFDPSAWNDRMLLFPIPLQVIQSNPEKIKQNDGY